MKRKEIESSMIRSVGYDTKTSILEVEFKNGDVWQYSDFPKTSWQELNNSESQGKYFVREVKGRYIGEKI